ncbi:MAG: MipA/OmpV family protein [Desulfoprunum sp.]|nr:MipA/OmpV family protein [Desulfoprunum sp.]
MLMHKNLFKACCFAIILVGAGPGWCLAGLPPQLSEIVRQHYPGSHIESFEEKHENDQLVYKIEIESEDEHRTLEMREDGEILTDEEKGGLPLIGGSLSLGFGVTSETSVYKGADDELQIDPAIVYRNKRFQLQAYDGINTSYDVFAGERLRIAVFGELFTEGFDASDSRYLQGMTEPDMVFAAGLATFYRTDVGEFELKLLNDVTGEHDGQNIELAYKYPFRLFGAEITPSVSVTYLSAKAVDYYYGVSVAESRVGRPVYAPDSALNVSAELMGVYPLTSNLFLVGIVNDTRLGSSVKDSPIVDSANEFSATLGVLYTF